MKRWQGFAGLALAVIALGGYFSPYIKTPWASRSEIRQLAENQYTIASGSLCYVLESLRDQFIRLRETQRDQRKKGSPDPYVARRIESMGKRIGELEIQAKKLKLPCR